MQNFEILIASAVKICKHLQTASASMGRSTPDLLPEARCKFKTGRDRSHRLRL